MQGIINRKGLSDNKKNDKSLNKCHMIELIASELNEGDIVRLPSERYEGHRFCVYELAKNKMHDPRDFTVYESIYVGLVNLNKKYDGLFLKCGIGNNITFIRCRGLLTEKLTSKEKRGL